MSAPEIVGIEFADGEYVAIPPSGHGQAVLCPAVTGGVLVICHCSCFAAILDSEELALAELGLHLAEVAS